MERKRKKSNRLLVHVFPKKSFFKPWTWFRKGRLLMEGADYKVNKEEHRIQLKKAIGKNEEIRATFIK
jgi:hypothetical protein